MSIDMTWIGSASSTETSWWSYVRIAQLKSRAFLITADRLVRSTTSAISRTIASNRLLSTDIRNGSMRRVAASKLGAVRDIRDSPGIWRQ